MDLLAVAQNFMNIVDSGGLTAASHRFDVPVSVLSKQLNWLEKKAGKQLIHRTTRRITITEAGKVFYEEARKLIDAKQNAFAALADIDPEPHGKIRLAIPNSLYRTRMLNVITEFLISYPKVKIETINANLPYMLLENQADIVFSSYELEESDIIRVPLKNFCLGVYASPEYLKRHGAPKTLEELVRHNCLIGLQHRPVGSWVFAHGKSIKVCGNFSSDSTSILIRVAVNGLGLLYATESVVRLEVAAGLLRKVELDVTPYKMQTYLYHRWVEKTSIIKLLVEYIQQHFTQD